MPFKLPHLKQKAPSQREVKKFKFKKEKRNVHFSPFGLRLNWSKVSPFAKPLQQRRLVNLKSENGKKTK